MTERNTNKFTMVNKDWFCLENSMIELYKHEAFLIMVLLLKRRTIRNEVIFSIEYIRSALGINKTSTDSINRIKNTLKMFEDGGLLKYDVNIDNVSNTDDITGDILQPLAASQDGGNFVSITDFELDTILNTKTDAVKSKLFTLFAYIKGCINEKTKVWRISNLSLMKYTKINSNPTILKYLKILQNQLGLILYASAGTYVHPDGVREVNNVFTLNHEGHVQILEDELIKDSNKYNTFKKNQASDKKRSDTQKNNHQYKKYLSESHFGEEDEEDCPF